MEVDLTMRDIIELRYLEKQGKPLWSGVRARGGDPDIFRWLKLGLIREYGDGYVITEDGRKRVRMRYKRCPTCGHATPGDPNSE